MIRLAENAGYCFGVNRACELVDSLLKEGKTVFTLGPLIHNPQTVEEYRKKGVKIIDSPEQAAKGSVVVIRSHGVSDSVKQRLYEHGVEVADATCPFVAKIQQIVDSNPDKTIFIFGDENHPEVVGIRGYCHGVSYVFSDFNEFKAFFESNTHLHNEPLIIVAQTTYNKIEWGKSIKFLSNSYSNIEIFDTICNATINRQIEAEELARESDLMIVIGGRESSNTRKLRDICSSYCDTVLVETAEELPSDKIKRSKIIGVTAGASTHASIIKEVLKVMTEIKNQTNQEKDEVIGTTEHDRELSFEEAVDASFKSVQNGERVKGVVLAISPNELQVDIGTKHAGFIPLSELSADPSAKPEDIANVGDELELLVLRVNDVEGTVMLSKRRLDAIAVWEEIVAAVKDRSILEGIVTEVVNGGVIVSTKGVRVFIPASQVDLNKGEALDSLLNSRVKYRVFEVNRNRKKAIGSIKSVSREIKKAKAEAVYSAIKVGDTYTGTVKSLTDYGAFVDIGGVDGMVHISELSWNRIKHPSEVVNVGDNIKVYVKDFDQETRKISLGYKSQADNPWEIFKNKYAVGSIANVKIVGLTDFGSFAEIIPGIDGLIHVSQISDKRIDKPSDVLKIGDTIDVKIIGIDFDNRRVSLSIKALADNSELELAENTTADSVPEEAEEAENTEQQTV